MAAVTTAIERRRDPRVAAAGTEWRAEAVLRPGQPVVLVNISSCGALVESGTRLRPGARTELQLAAETTRRTIRGRLERCYVAGLEPIRYRGVVMFDESEDTSSAFPLGPSRPGGTGT